MLRHRQFNKVGPALDLLSDMSGANGPRRYMIAVANEAEMRGTGGMILSYGTLLAQNGKFTLDLPMVHAPGATYAYCSGTVNLLGGVLKVVFTLINAVSAAGTAGLVALAVAGMVNSGPSRSRSTRACSSPF